MASLEATLPTSEVDSPEAVASPIQCMEVPAETPKESVAPTKLSDRLTCCLVVGMAGSGKTTLMQRINHYAVEQVEAEKREKAEERAAAAASGGGGGSGGGDVGDDPAEDAVLDAPTYYVNMDPGVTQVPFAAGIDIRDTVDYKQVMKQYNLGPNGGILTSLNLFATRFDQVLDILEKRAAKGTLKHVFFDTPGQIEVFTWSASGMIITETLAVKFPTVLLYVVDTPRTTNPTTFMSNMLYACSMLYKTNLPLVLVFSKTDVQSAEFAMEWMADFEKFQEALDAQREQSYMSSLNRSMGLVLDEFYANLRAVAVSSATGEGLPELMKAIADAAEEYEECYLPELQRRKAVQEARHKKEQEAEMQKLMKDVSIDKEQQRQQAQRKQHQQQQQQQQQQEQAAPAAASLETASGATARGGGAEKETEGRGVESK
eukprot:CAMPEP_0171905838 /NCGR_PEP_ID=MMETSP0993-20121228/5466_1 /TAXON_ID=483369 /ORGANISM="non described non described, Strain CCMP2098" /LENGTH=430 /DNA_ID=CAMNT_0012537431 /DNA_START=12 /DNA_END=1304 /DNA_ORIENTATION=+